MSQWVWGEIEPLSQTLSHRSEGTRDTFAPSGKSEADLHVLTHPYLLTGDTSADTEDSGQHPGPQLLPGPRPSRITPTFRVGPRPAPLSTAVNSHLLPSSLSACSRSLALLGLRSLFCFNREHIFKK